MNLYEERRFWLVSAPASADAGVMTVIEFPLDSGRIETDSDLEAAFRVDYFDEELQTWIACASLRDHIFDDDDTYEDDRVIA